MYVCQLSVTRLVPFAPRSTCCIRKNILLQQVLKDESGRLSSCLEEVRVAARQLPNPKEHSYVVVNFVTYVQDFFLRRCFLSLIGLRVSKRLKLKKKLKSYI